MRRWSFQNTTCYYDNVLCLQQTLSKLYQSFCTQIVLFYFVLYIIIIIVTLYFIF